MNSSTRYNGHDAPRRVAAIHRQGDQFSVVLAEMRSGRAQVTESHSVAARDSERLTTLLGRLGADRVVRVLPGGSVVCRLIEIPPLDDSAAIEAAVLQAEADLPAMLAAHRRSVALLPWRTPMDNRVAAAFGWPGERPGDLPTALEGITYCGESAALLELLIHSGRNEGLIASLDREHRSMELAAHVLGVTSVRTARLNDEQWSSDAARVAVETMLSAGADDAGVTEIETRVSNAARMNRQSLVLDADLAQRLSRTVSGANSDTAWWNRYGVAVGAALAMLGPRRSMADLLEEAPQVPRGPLVALLHWIGQRAHARNVAVAALLLIVVAPVLGELARYAILEFKTRQLKAVEAAFRERQDEADFFRTLRNHRWPMTKILADISGMAPYSIDFESISIDSSRVVTISGTAPLGEQADVLEFQNQLNKSHLFAEVKSPNFTFGDNKIEFELQASVANPQASVERPYNEPLAVVIHGEEARGLEPGEYLLGSFNLGGRARPRNVPRSSPSSGLGDGSGGGPFRAPSSAAPLGDSPPTGSNGSPAGGEKPLPEALSDAAISKMNADEVQRALLARAAVKSRDPRLQQEWDKLLERSRQIKADGSDQP